jgi:hypothetical protein
MDSLGDAQGYGDIVTEPTELWEIGRNQAREEALADFRSSMDAMVAMDTDGIPSEDAVDRLLLNIFEAGYKYAANMSASEPSMESLEGVSENPAPAPLESIRLLNERFHGKFKVSDILTLFESFIEHQGQEALFDQFLKLVALQAEREANPAEW